MALTYSLFGAHPGNIKQTQVRYVTLRNTNIYNEYDGQDWGGGVNPQAFAGTGPVLISLSVGSGTLSPLVTGPPLPKKDLRT